MARNTQGSGSDLTALTGVWAKTSQGGNVRYEGRVNSGLRLVIFTNTRKEEGSNQPDLEAFFSNVQKEGEERSEKSELIRLTGLWEKTSQAGNVRYEGRVNDGLRLIMFPNNRKEEGSNQPDFQTYFSPARKAREDGGGDDSGE